MSLDNPRDGALCTRTGHGPWFGVLDRKRYCSFQDGDLSGISPVSNSMWFKRVSKRATKLIDR